MTRQQIILLTLFVSLVTSIATGIVTVSLVDQQNPGTVSIINRVVEKTIDSVSANPKEEKAVAMETIKTPATASKEALKGVVRIHKKVEGAEPSFIGLGVIVTGEGIIVADKLDIVPDGTYAVTQNGKEYPVTQIIYKDQSNIVFLRIKQTKELKPAVFADIGNLTLGQELIMFKANPALSVHTGIIESLQLETSKGKDVSTITFSFPAAETLPGSLLFTLTGEFVGIRSDAASTTVNSFVPNTFIRTLLQGLT